MQPLGNENTNLSQYGHDKKLPRIIESRGWPLINYLYGAIPASSFLFLLIDNAETSLSELPTITPILLHFSIPIFRFPEISGVSDMILKEFGFESIPFDQIGLSIAHILDLGLFELRAHSRLARGVGTWARMTSVSERMGVKI